MYLAKDHLQESKQTEGNIIRCQMSHIEIACIHANKHSYDFSCLLCITLPPFSISSLSQSNSICLFLFLSVCLSVCLFVCICLFLFLLVSLSLSRPSVTPHGSGATNHGKKSRKPVTLNISAKCHSLTEIKRNGNKTCCCSNRKRPIHPQNILHLYNYMICPVITVTGLSKCCELGDRYVTSWAKKHKQNICLRVSKQTGKINLLLHR